MTPYTEPELAILVLDYCKPLESHVLLKSIEKHVKVPHKVIFCDNGSNEDYSLKFLREGLIDQLIINRESTGLGLGTRDLHALAQSKYVGYVQNDQIFGADLTVDAFTTYRQILDSDETTWTLDGFTYNSVKSISLAGYPCGRHIFSERAFLMRTDFYKSLEPLSFGGAGKYHEYPWREGQIQEIYKKNGWAHVAIQPIVMDNGVFATRDMGTDGGVFCHRTDSKELWVIVQPKQFNPSYPKLSDSEKTFILNHGWIDGTIPEAEKKDSFRCWDNTALAQAQDLYIADLRRRFKEKGR